MKEIKAQGKRSSLCEAETANLALFIEKEALILEFYSLGAKNFKDESYEKILKFRA